MTDVKKTNVAVNTGTPVAGGIMVTIMGQMAHTQKTKALAATKKTITVAAIKKVTTKAIADILAVLPTAVHATTKIAAAMAICITITTMTINT